MEERTAELARANDDLKAEIAERKRAEERLKNTRFRLERALNFTEALLTAVPTPVFYKDVEGKYLGCNRAFSELWASRLIR